MDIGMVLVQDLAAGETLMAGIKWRRVRIRPAGTKQRLGKTSSQECLADMFRPGKKIGMAHTFSRDGALQCMDGMVVANHIPCLTGVSLVFAYHDTIMVAETGQKDNSLISRCRSVKQRFACSGIAGLEKGQALQMFCTSLPAGRK